MLNKMKLRIIFLIVLIVSANCSRTTNGLESEGKDVIIDPIIPQPKFPGDVEGLKKYLKDNYKWTQTQSTIEGTVYVQFLVGEDGSVSETKIIRGLCDTCDKEAIRLVENMPKWEPASEGGRQKATRMVVPIKFGLTNPYE